MLSYCEVKPKSQFVKICYHQQPEEWRHPFLSPGAHRCPTWCFSPTTVSPSPPHASPWLSAGRSTPWSASGHNITICIVIFNNNNNNNDYNNHIERNNFGFVQSPHSAVNRFLHVRSSGQGAIMCKSRPTHQVIITYGMSCAMCFFFFFFFFFLRSPAISLGFTTFGWDFCVCDRFFNPTIKVVTFRLRGWCVLGVFLLSAFTRLGHEHQDLLSPRDEMHVCTD